MRQKIKLQCGLFMKEFLKQLARKGRTKQWLAEDAAPGQDPHGGKTI
jgi:hypothetical protein